MAKTRDDEVEPDPENPEPPEPEPEPEEPMQTMIATPATADEVVLSMQYDPTGLASVSIYENHVLAWCFDSADETVPPSPRIVGVVEPPPAVDTSPVLSPPWACWWNGALYVPGVTRIQSVSDFFTWLATNNGARRKLAGYFVQPRLNDIWVSWVRANPDLVDAGAPPLP